MSRTLTALLIVTNVATGYQAWIYYQRHQAAISSKTTDREREVFGAACVDWLNEKTKEREVSLAVGRSWKKHGQLVFEIIPASGQDWAKVVEKLPAEELPAVICTYDRQSGVMFAATGSERDRWMFYE
ncbi:hypothetical protein [Fuscibacter oryzae]|uniref:Uncharacterized protein n=1 Tax=Fuscibacter oryzae TaxID=2803939 RepID=A0A8J7MNA3_9RHOB|nr:hypothetical protein [Fuscibacter oryzae]MBL4928005.1 hypothetical protein [Fuscibacter oryzae]